MSIHDHLVRIQAGLHVPKDQNNQFGGFKYRNAEQILAAVKPLLEGCTVVLNDTMVEVGGRVYCRAEAVLSDGEAVLSASAYAREPLTKKGMDEAQISGSCSSYARKYALTGIFAIDSSDTKDADETDQPTIEEQINSAMSRDDLADLWRQMTAKEKTANEAAFVERSKHLEKEA